LQEVFYKENPAVLPTGTCSYRTSLFGLAPLKLCEGEPACSRVLAVLRISAVGWFLGYCAVAITEQQTSSNKGNNLRSDIFMVQNFNGRRAAK